ncbi:hypothetical protein AB0B74_07845 [Micromonospora parva]|uniref:hypothetical protein n=1 Tax=Micromonospora parva TaxID=1464048 RepID=UPI0033BFB94D
MGNDFPHSGWHPSVNLQRQVPANPTYRALVDLPGPITTRLGSHLRQMQSAPRVIGVTIDA